MFDINVCILIGGTGKRQKNCNSSPYLGEIQCETYFELIRRKTVISLRARFPPSLKHASGNVWYQRVRIFIGGTGKIQKYCNSSPFLGEIQCETYFELIRRKTVISLRGRFPPSLKYASGNVWYQRVYLDRRNWKKTTKLQFESLPGRISL